MHPDARKRPARPEPNGARVSSMDRAVGPDGAREFHPQAAGFLDAAYRD